MRLSKVLLCGAVLIASPSFVLAQDTTLLSVETLLDQPADNIEGALQKALLSSPRGALKDSEALKSFYKARGFEPYWVRSSSARGRADDFLEVIEKSWTHGLNPHAYHLREIEALIDTREREQLVDLELFLSDAFIRLGQDLTGIRVNPRPLKSHVRYWRKPLEGAELLIRMAGSSDPDDVIEDLEPQGRTYKTLQQELARLVRSEPEYYEAVLPLRLKKRMLNPYERDPVMPDLRVRLGMNVPQSEDPYLYDDALAAAIIRFQRDNGLKADGIIGRQTLDILNRSRAQKIPQIIANMERLRWVEEEKPEKFVVVNVPSAMLWAVEDGRVQFEMPVIVGRKKRPTNIFITEIHGVRFNPDWTVPPTIKRDDILPKLQEDPEYLTHKGMQLVSGLGAEAVTLDPLAFDWSNITEEELKELRMIQIPGAHNPLGQIRVLMPNTYNIYLHDTNEPHYFERANRAASSGCVRMKEPELMADFIMEEKDSWDAESLEYYVSRSKTSDVFIPEPIPVYILYYTVWVNGDGDLVYGQDLYEYDKYLIKMLEDIDGIFIPVDNTEDI